MNSHKPLTARNADGVPRVVSIGRLSRPKETEAETQESLESMRRENERLLDSVFPGPKLITFLGEQASGMLVNRESMRELARLIAADECDVVVAEDLSRIFRNPRYQWSFVQDCVDAAVRVVCFGDLLDTFDENWLTALMIATVRHGLSVEDAKRRVNRKSNTAFLLGGEVGKVRFGYAKVSREDAAAGKYGPKGLRIRRLDESTPIFDEIRRRFHEGHSPQSIVDWLNAENIAPGPYVESGHWTVKLFRDSVQDPLMHGMRTFRTELSVRVFGSGEFRREPNPNPDTQHVLELAHMSRDQQEAMLASVGWAIDWGGVKPSKQPSTRKGISRGRSRWPGQSATCSACGTKMFVHGKYLRCRHSLRRRYERCWMHLNVKIAPLRKVVVGWLVRRFHESAEFRAVLLPAVKEQLSHARKRQSTNCGRYQAAITALETRERNLRKSIGIAEKLTGESLESLVGDLATVTAELKKKRHLAEAAGGVKEPFIELSDEQIAEKLDEVLMHLIGSSFDMAEVVKGFVPQCVIVPVQALDSGQVHPRAKLYVCANMVDPDQLEELVVDLFEPPVHIRLMNEVMALRNQTPRRTLKQIGAALGTSYMTAKRAIRYHRLMEERGVTEPFVELHEKPANGSRWRHSA